MTKQRVLVIFGGRSGEHEVSLMSARSVIGNLDAERYEIYQVGITHAGVWLTGEQALEAFDEKRYGGLAQAVVLPNPAQPNLYLLQSGEAGAALRLVTPLDVIFPVLHGTFGEDGTLQGFLEMCGIAYVGAGVLSSAVGMDKAVFKDVMNAHGIPTLPMLLVNSSELQGGLDDLVKRAEQVGAYPLFVKPANCGSSVGVSKCSSRSDLLEGLLEAARFDQRILVERGISAREIEISVLGNHELQVSVAGEILPSREFYSYEAKYVDNASGLIIPAPLTPAQAEQARSLAIKAFQAVDGAGMARVDFLLDRATGELYLSEINTIPGFTQISMYPKLWQASGLPYADLLDRLIELAVERKAERDLIERTYSNL